MGMGLVAGLLQAVVRWVKAVVTLGGYFAKRRSEARAERQADREVILKAFEALQANFQHGLEALSKISVASSEAQAAQAAALQEWIQGFKQAATEPPTSHTLREQDELKIWQDQQLAVANLPPEIQALPYEQQLAWIMTTSGDPLY